ncbi:MAG: YdcF family protein [Oscillospiraceae bacterium]|nr:YdcF family protein [Oscillospiraceae bacterium]
MIIFAVFTSITALIISAYVKSSGGKRIIAPAEAVNFKADCIIILGCRVGSDMLRDRLDRGIELYKSGVSGRILMSGDHGREAYDEVNAMKQYAIDQGVSSEDVFMDHAGFSTYESMYRARDIFDVKSAVIVTQNYHLYRAVYNAEKLGLEVRGVGSDMRVYGGQWMRDLREVFARVKDFGMGIIKPKPTYLGEVIPIYGDGDATNDK